MRADRRHELKESDLVHALETGRTYFKKHGAQVGTVVFIVVAVVLVTSIVIRSRAATAEGLWRRRNTLSFDADTGKESMEQLKLLVQESDDQAFVLASLIDLGSHGLRLAAQVEDPPDAELNETAREAYESMLSRFGANPLAFGVAHAGLATVEENSFVLDGDPIHKERAREHLSAIMDNAALHTTPFYRLARDRRDALDAVFKPVAFAPPLPPEERPEDQPAVEIGGPSGPQRFQLSPQGVTSSSDSGGIQVKVVPTEDMQQETEKAGEPAEPAADEPQPAETAPDAVKPDTDG
jgi:hypothetical protein